MIEMRKSDSCRDIRKFVSLQSYIFSFSSSDLYELCFLEDSTFFTIADISNLPAIYSILVKLCHHLSFFLRINTDQQPSTCLGSISFPKFKVHDLVFNLNQTFVNRQTIDNKLNILLLCLAQIISMSKNAKSSNISAGSSLIFPQEIGSKSTQSCHLLLSPIVCLNELRFTSLLKYFITFLFTCLQPLHSIDSESNSKWFCQQDNISRISIIRHHKLIISHCSDCTASHHWPLIINCLPSAYLSS